MEVNWQEVIGFISLLGGFFYTLKKLVDTFSESHNKLMSLIQFLKGEKTG